MLLVILLLNVNSYLFEVNTKYTSSNVMKISVNSQVRSKSELSDIFNTWDEIVLIFTEKKVNFLFIFFSMRTNRIKTNFFPSHFSLILLGSVRLLGIILDEYTVCT